MVDKLGSRAADLIEGEAPAGLEGLPSPDAVFVGGGLVVPRLLERCWAALPSGGRLVANAVTLEGEARLLAFRDEFGGELTRIAISRAERIGAYTGWRPHMPVTQLAVTKR